MGKTGFTPRVAARTRTAEAILADDVKLAAYKDAFGKKKDLETIRDRGKECEAFNLGQSQAGAAGQAGTLDVLLHFAEIQKDYKKLMGGVQATRLDLVEAGADEDTLKGIDRILVNESAVVIRTIEAQEGQKSRKAVKSLAQEAVRAEIAKDTAALLDLDDAHAALTDRGITTKEIGDLNKRAEALSGKLASRAAIRGAGKAATKGERQAAAAQSDRWEASYRALALAGRNNPGIQSLLDEAAKAK